MSLILRFQDDDGDDGGYGDDGGNGHGGDDDGGDLYIIGAVCLYVCMSVCMSVTKRHHFSYSRDLVNSYQTKKKTLPEKILSMKKISKQKNLKKKKSPKKSVFRHF